MARVALFGLCLVGFLIPYSLHAEEFTKYLFVYFPSNSNENVYYALSDNGYDYTPMNDGQRTISADTISLKKGVRDPHILRGEDGFFYMVLTDMRCAEGWDSNRGLVMMRSKNLVSWEHATVHFPEKYKGTMFAKVTRVWAPETIWDPQAQKYMVYFSLLTSDNSIPYDKVFYCYANEDFTDLEGEPTFLYDRGSATIDMNIVYNEEDGLYHGFYKNEGSGGICKVTAAALTAPDGEPLGSQWSSPSAPLQQTTEPVEGAGVFHLIDEDTWVLMYDCYKNGHYQFCTSPDLNTFTFKQDTPTTGIFTPRHGTVIPVTDAEVETINAYFLDEARKTLETAVAQMRQLYDTPHTETAEGVDAALTEALATIEGQKSSCTKGSEFSALTEQAHTAMLTFLNGVSATDVNQPFDITFMLVNPDFDEDATTGWTFTNGAPGYDAQCAEFYERTFNFYQNLTQMPKGVYQLRAYAFQRAGETQAAYAKYAEGQETITTQLYINSTAKAVASIFDDRQSTRLYNNDIQVGDNTYVPCVMSAASTYFAKGLYDSYVNAESKNTTLRVGIRCTKSTPSYYWSIFDHFRLYFFGQNREPVGIHSIENGEGTMDNADNGEWFDLSGRRINSKLSTLNSQLPRGIYLLRQGDGQSRKVYIK